MKGCARAYDSCMIDACAANGACTFNWNLALTTAKWMCDAACMKLNCPGKNKNPCVNSVCQHFFPNTPAKCVTSPAMNGIACNDKNAKTLVDWCQNGKCVGAGVSAYCYSTGDPHYYSTFWKKKWNFYGIANFLLASALNSEIWTQTYKCARVSCNYGATIVAPMSAQKLTFNVRDWTLRNSQGQVVAPGQFDGGVIQRVNANQYIWTVKQGNTMFITKFNRGFWKKHRVYYMNVYAYVVDPSGKVVKGGSCWAKPNKRPPPPPKDPFNPKNPTCPKGFTQYTATAKKCCLPVKACSQLWQSCMVDACNGGCINPVPIAKNMGVCDPLCAKVAQTCQPKSNCEVTTCVAGKCIRSAVPNCNKCTGVKCVAPDVCSKATCNKATGKCQITTNKACKLCGKWKTSTTCNKVAGCSWDNGAKKCDNFCVKLTTQAACRANTNCGWNANTKCTPICSTATKSATACRATVGCKWVANTCVPGCKGQTSAAACTKFDECQWINQKTCVPKCRQWTTAVKCKAATECQWDNNKGCVPGCLQSTTPTTCNQNIFQCQWDPKQKQCDVEICINQPQAKCKSGNCMWSQKLKKCLPECITTTSQTACKANPHCTWKGATGVKPCVPVCTPITTSAKCQQQRGCEWVNNENQCEPICRYSTTATCQKDLRCQWNAGKQACVPRCLGATQAGCQKLSECNWISGTGCVQTCTAITSQTKCAGTTGCAWNPGSQRCSPGCPGITTAQDCNGQATCEWNRFTKPQKCQTACVMRKSAATCGQAPWCQWDNTKGCTPACTTFTASGPCDAAAQCQWNNKDNKCEPLCKVLGNQANCQKNGGCAWNQGAQVCQPLCLVHGTNQGNCQRDPRCTWNPKAGRCTTVCAKGTTAGTCNKMGDCTWSATNNQCLPLCLGHRSATTCNADGNCNWNGKGCSPFCKTLTPAKCKTNVRCTVNAQTNTCEPLCRGMKLKANCQKQLGCEWDSQADVCNPTCTTAANQAQCMQYKDCVWANKAVALRLTGQTNKQCVPMCISSKTQANCVADKGCTWTGTQCHPICQKQTTQTGCTGTGMCLWHPLTKTCDPICRPLAQTDCGNNPACMWNAGNTMCVPRCIQPTFNAATCKQTPLCVVNAAGNKCVPVCMQHASEQVCNADKSCTWHAKKCSPICVQLSSQQTCANDGNCKWNTGTKKCAPICKPVTTSTACKAVAGGVCVWDTATKSCEPNLCRKNKGETPCKNSLGCKWVPGTGVCTEDLCGKHNAQVCAGTDGCMWNPASNKCIDNPCTGLTQTDCGNKGGCKWNAGTNNCKPDCVDNKSQTACEGDTGCKWNPRSNFCTVTCPRITDAGVCAADAQCQWNLNTNKCTVSCDRLKQTDCVKAPNCNWNPGKRTCTTGCQQHTAQTPCNLDTDCTWFNNNCQKDCPLRRTQTDCGSSTMCKWNAKPGQPGTCGQACPAVTDSQLCAKDAFCRWDTNNNQCTDACMTKTSQSLCAVPGCTWNANQKPMCNDNCPNFKSESDCQTNPQCFWHIDYNTQFCADICSRILNQNACEKNKPACLWDSRNLKCVKEGDYDFYPNYDPDVVDHPDKPGGPMGNTLCCLAFTDIVTGPNCKTSIGVTATAPISTLKDYDIEAVMTDGTIQHFDLGTGQMAAGDEDFITANTPADFDDFFPGETATQVPTGNIAQFDNRLVKQWHIKRNGLIVDVVGGGGWGQQTQQIDGCGGWAHRKDNSGPDEKFFPGNWDFEDGALSGAAKNPAATKPAPIGQWTNNACKGVICTPATKACQAAKCLVGTCTTVNKMPGSACTSGNPLDDNEKCTGIMAPDPECAGTDTTQWVCRCQEAKKVRTNLHNRPECDLLSSEHLTNFVTPKGRAWDPSLDFGRQGWKKFMINGKPVIKARGGAWVCKIWKGP
eukprot:TRINITY_DN63855_c0_g1_i1.p1 TRINITY_DN63855_c0_g1~~TRINITY_DN63855_c0_g1_i1.p1  ORF type:complete len:1965 (-),score=444.99 TRINITY_DN63855_c0_g1_i1:205-5880(-)